MTNINEYVDPFGLSVADAMEVRGEVIRPQLSAEERLATAEYRRMLEAEIEAEKIDKQNKLDMWVEDNTPKKGVVTTEVWNVPIPSHNDYIKNKDVDYLIYSELSVNSKYGGKANNMETQRYIYKNALDYKEVADVCNVSESTVKRAFSRLKKVKVDGNFVTLISTENTPNGIVYKLNYGVDDKYYVTIPNNTLQYLIDTSNSNMIKLYVFFKVQLANGSKEMQREFIADALGFNTSNIKMLDKVSNMTKDLMAKGLLTKTERVEFFYDEKTNREIPKTLIRYSLTTYEQWVTHMENVGKTKYIH